ncbi:MAG TPA: LysR substrate-binding domain-containing protein [Rhodocyclaceae bacterium]|nr:LysR substrate-binding domain-containing protein [Rhodocyclaceae bacterium]HRQ46052.1 LysR substrate-binding domain-containing protein [Rhodocyclaceae bacterium]
MRTIELDELEIFHAVVTQGGVARAAQALNRVPSNVTTRIKQLEERLGVALFSRHGRRLVLTMEGRLLLGYAERLLRLAGEAESAVRSGQPLGVFRLGSLESTAGSRLPPILSAYNRTYPDVRVELVTGTTGALITRLMRHDIEAAFVSEPFTAPGLLFEPVFDEELVLISGMGVPAIRSASEVGRATLIAFANGCSYRKRLEDWLGDSNILPERVLEFGSYPAIVACVAAGTGLAIVPRSVLAALNASAEIRQHPLPPSISRNRTHLLWHPGIESLALQGLRALVLKWREPPATTSHVRT